MTEAASWALLLPQLFLVDLVLGADNAVVIGFACGGLNPGDARRAAVFGAAGAIALRLLMVLFADVLLGAPFFKLLAAWILVAVALNVKAQKNADPLSPGAFAAKGDFATAAVVIVAADAAMSLDNVVALASIANGNYWALTIGVLMSIPIIVYGALVMNRILDRLPDLLLLGAAFLGWVAGGMAVSDPLVAGWVATYAPALPFIAPALFAGFVLLAGGPNASGGVRSVASARQAGSQAPRPAPLEIAASSRPLPATPPSTLARPFLGLTDESLLVAGLALLTGLAGLMLGVASYFDSLF